MDGARDRGPARADVEASVNVVLVDPAELAPDGTVTLTDARAEHVRTVLGATAGARARVGVIDGPLGTACVERVDGRAVVLRCDELAPAPPPRPRVDLLLAVPRPKVLKRLWAPLAQLGVGRILLTSAARVEKYYFDSHAVTPELWRTRLLEGLAQARDTRVPIVTVHRSLERLVANDLDRLSGDAHRLLADVELAGTERPLTVRDACRELRTDSRVLLAVGPEGGWRDDERALLGERGFTAVTLGPRALRTDVACIALLALAHEALEATAATRRAVAATKP